MFIICVPKLLYCQLLQFIVWGDCCLLQGHDESKFGVSSEELMKLVESAQTGTLQPERLSQILAAASLAVGQDCRGQLLMQLILLIQQQLAATETSSTVQNQTAEPSAIVQLWHDIDYASLNSSVKEKSQSLNTGRKCPSDVERGNIDKENEMDKLLAWKNRIENASVTNGEHECSSVEVIAEEPASPDPAVHVSESSCATGDRSFAASVDMTSCVATDVLQSVSCSTVSLSPASPLSADYPPLPTPPKPPDNLLLNVRQGWSSELCAPPLPFPLTVNSAISETPSVSADTACLPRLSVPISTATAASFAISDKLTVAQLDDCACPKVSSMSSSHNSSYSPVIIVSDTQMPFETLSYDASHGSTDSSSVNLLSTENCTSENKVWCSGFSNSTCTSLNSVHVDHGVPYSILDTVATLSEEPPRFHQKRDTRLQSPSAWMSRLASPSAFMLQSSVSQLQAVNERPEAAFIGHKLADQFNTTELMSHPVYCAQPRMLPEHQHSPSTVDSCHFLQHSDVFNVSQSEARCGQLTVDDRQGRDFSTVSSDSYVLKSREGEGSDTECRTISNSHLSVCDDQHSHGETLRMSTDNILMRLAGMLPVDTDASDVSLTQRPDCNMASSNFCGMERCDETSEAVALSCAVDVMSHDELSVTVQSSQQTTSQQQQRQPDMNDDELEEGEIVDDCSPTPAGHQHDLPQATQQLLLFLKTDPVRNSSSSQWLQPRVSTGEMTYHHRDDRREDFYKYQRTNSNRRR